MFPWHGMFVVLLDFHVGLFFRRLWLVIIIRGRGVGVGGVWRRLQRRAAWNGGEV